MQASNDNQPAEELSYIAERFMTVGARFLDQGMYYDALDAFLMSKEIYTKLGVLNDV